MRYCRLLYLWNLWCFRVWIFGAVLCKINNFVALLTVSLNVFTLLAISLDRRKVSWRPNIDKLSLNASTLISSDVMETSDRAAIIRDGDIFSNLFNQFSFKLFNYPCSWLLTLKVLARRFKTLNFRSLWRRWLISPPLVPPSQWFLSSGSPAVSSPPRPSSSHRKSVSICKAGLDTGLNK